MTDHLWRYSPEEYCWIKKNEASVLRLHPDGEISEGYVDPMIETLNATRSLAATPFETYHFKGLNS
jgi:hypothetical protein